MAIMPRGPRLRQEEAIFSPIGSSVGLACLAREKTLPLLMMSLTGHWGGFRLSPRFSDRGPIEEPSGPWPSARTRVPARDVPCNITHPTTALFNASRPSAWAGPRGRMAAGLPCEQEPAPAAASAPRSACSRSTSHRRTERSSRACNNRRPNNSVCDDNPMSVQGSRTPREATDSESAWGGFLFFLGRYGHKGVARRRPGGPNEPPAERPENAMAG